MWGVTAVLRVRSPRIGALGGVTPSSALRLLCACHSIPPHALGEQSSWFPVSPSVCHCCWANRCTYVFSYLLFIPRRVACHKNSFKKKYFILKYTDVQCCVSFRYAAKWLSAQSCLTLCDPMNRSTPGLPVHHQLPEFTQTHIHWVGDAIQPSHPLSSPSPSAPNPSQHHSLFQWVSSLPEVAKVLEFQL